MGKFFHAIGQVLGILKWALIAIALVALAATMYYGTDFVRSSWRTVTAPFSIFGTAPKHDLVTPANEQQRKQELDALATMMAYDSKCELNESRPQVMLEMGRAAIRIQIEHRKKLEELAKKQDKAEAAKNVPDISLTAIVEGADTWRPEDWDPQKQTRISWRNRELDRMRKRVTPSELVDARKIADQIYGKNPGDGPIRYTRPDACDIRQTTVRWWSNADGAANAIRSNPKLEEDPELEKLGSKTRFYRRKK